MRIKRMSSMMRLWNLLGMESSNGDKLLYACPTARAVLSSLCTRLVNYDSCFEDGKSLLPLERMPSAEERDAAFDASLVVLHILLSFSEEAMLDGLQAVADSELPIQ